MGRYLQLTVGEPSAGSALGHNSCLPLVHLFILIFIQHMFIPILQQGRMMLTFVCCRVCVCVRWTLAAACVCVFVNHVRALDVVEMQLGFVFK